mgnify:CR=1 FL=1
MNIKELYRQACAGVYESAFRHSNALLLLGGVGLLFAGLADPAIAQGNITGSGKYAEACNYLLGLIEGPFGALITAAAGVGAIVAAALGGFKMAWTLVVVAVGAFILRAYITLFFAGCGWGGGVGNVGFTVNAY